MSKSANAGELRTPIKVLRTVNGNTGTDPKDNTDDEGYPIVTDKNVFGEGAVLWVKWVNAHGTEAMTAMQMKLREPATITCRFSPKLTPDCIIYKGSDPSPYEIISLDDVEDRHEWLEIKVQRKVNGR